MGNETFNGMTKSIKISKFWVPLGTGYRENFRSWVLLGTRYRRNFKRWVLRIDKILELGYR